MKNNCKDHINNNLENTARNEPHDVLAGVLIKIFDGTPRPVLVAVGGPGGVGKSTFAANLARALGRASVLNLDDYKTPREQRASKNIFGAHPEANEMLLLSAHLLHLRRGEPIEKPLYCREAGRISAYETFTPDRFVIVEGEIATYREFREEIDFSIFIDSDWKTQLNTRLKRDIEQRGYTTRKAIATFLYSNLYEFAEHGAESKNWADVHVHCGEDYSLVIEAVSGKYSAFIPG